MAITMIVNGSDREVPGDGARTLLDALRDDLGLTGTKLGCGEGACGACAVLVGSRVVQACQVDAASVAGQRITTVEGLAEDGILHPVQQAWLELGAMQCGYCTPGWLMGTAALLARVPHPSDERIDADLAGHACRCCAYPRIRRAVHRAAELMEHPELLEPVPAPSEPTGSPADPASPLDLSRAQPGSFAAAMPEGMVTVVADPGEPGFAGPDDAWVHVGADGAITAFTGKVEAGQGTRTALSLLVAEELAVPADAIRLVMADTDTSPFDLGTFGSRSMPHAAPPLRAAAAAALRVLRQVAADRFGLPTDDLTAADGWIAGPDGAPSASYGELVAGAHRVERVPADAPVTPASQWHRTAGRPARAAGAADVVTGRKLYPSDLRLSEMLHGAALHAPAAGATLRGADTAAAASIPGVTVVRDGDFVGVVAPQPRLARAALAAITADWAESGGPGPAELDDYLRAHPVSGEGWFGAFRDEDGDPDRALRAGAVRLAATYRTAYVAHVPLEPRAALARFDGGELTVWVATSTPFRARAELAAELGLDPARVHVLVPDFGGGFGGKHGSAVALEAARLASAAGRPVRVQWSRRDEFTAGYLRPAAVIDITSATDAAGRLTGWSVTNINSGTAGLLTPYQVPHRRHCYQPARSPLSQGSYRALAATANNFARESHIDEVAAAVGADPVEFRLRHLDDARLRAVLSAAAAEIGWPGDLEPTGLPDRVGTGIALGREKGGRVATAARAAVAPDGTLRLLRLVTAVDCGAVVHPDGLVNQIEGAVVMGLGPALFERIEFAGGRILNPSMSDYRVPRLPDVPTDVTVILIDRPDDPPAGGGEAPIMAVAPAIANAIFRACGVRLRSMPLVPAGRVPRTAG
ncbi:MAG TPA: molybdopterin cofactor-binding domain-containing protein [Streptosporangiaceae bacterium]|nr:molybdopterin cofactor-binding domain-containing protein [Streptosporangiaceae bacterium]